MMAVVSVVLLIVGVAGALLRPFRLASWTVPLACALAALSFGAISLTAAHHALDPLAEPIAFLLAAVPLAVLLDRLGFFSILAEHLIATGRGVGALWVLAALVTTVLNLDASVVLLTPLYVRIARQTGRDPLTLAFQPVLLASLASSALPVSNLTNLIAVSWTSADTLDFVTHLGLPSLAATAVGWWRYRQVLHPDHVATEPQHEHNISPPPASTPDQRATLITGGAVLTLVLIGFLAGPSIGIKAWMVALFADLALLALVRRAPWTAIPWGTAIVAGSLGVLAAAAVEHLPIDQLISTNSNTTSLAGTLTATAIASNVANNLPALLVSLPVIGHHPTSALWAVLVGVNMGPVVLVTGSLASLLWLDTLGRLGVRADARDFARIGIQVGLPATIAGASVFLALSTVIH